MIKWKKIFVATGCMICTYGVLASATSSTWTINALSTNGQLPKGSSLSYQAVNGAGSAKTTSQRGDTNVTYSVMNDIAWGVDTPTNCSWKNMGSGNYTTKANQKVYIEAQGWTTSSKIDASGNITY